MFLLIPPLLGTLLGRQPLPLLGLLLLLRGLLLHESLLLGSLHLGLSNHLVSILHLDPSDRL
jgi:hypothetical protein